MYSSTDANADEFCKLLLVSETSWTGLDICSETCSVAVNNNEERSSGIRDELVIFLLFMEGESIFIKFSSAVFSKLLKLKSIKSFIFFILFNVLIFEETICEFGCKWIWDWDWDFNLFNNVG